MEITLESPLDMHLHLRDGDMLRLTAPLSEDFAGAVIMPNLVPPLTDAEALQAYAARVDAAMQSKPFTRLMTLFFKPYSAAQLEAARKVPEFFGLKLYPAGVTTNSEGGIAAGDDLTPTLGLMADMGIPLLVHGESHGFVMNREADFLPIYRQLARQFPQLRICMEHITTAAALRLLDEHENLCATVTLQHLLITLDDVVGGSMRPHLFCKPIAKLPTDRDALLRAALDGHPQLMFGSDSAPHPRHKKECCGCAAGVFTAPVALPRLAALFAEHDKLPNLQAFVSDNARRLYGITPIRRSVILRDTPMHVPTCYKSYGEQVVPMFAGETLPWSVQPA